MIAEKATGLIHVSPYEPAGPARAVADRQTWPDYLEVARSCMETPDVAVSLSSTPRTEVGSCGNGCAL